MGKPMYFFRDNRDKIEMILSSFHWCLENMMPEATKDEKIKRFMDDQLQTEKIYAELWVAEDQAYTRNMNVLKILRSVKGKTFVKHLRRFLKECEAKFTVPFIITRDTRGDWVEEKWGKEIQRYWVDQRCTNIEGDSFEGYIWVQLREGRFLKFFYTC